MQMTWMEIQPATEAVQPFALRPRPTAIAPPVPMASMGAPMVTHWVISLARRASSLILTSTRPYSSLLPNARTFWTI